jgi:hypothetical protein
MNQSEQQWLAERLAEMNAWLASQGNVAAANGFSDAAAILGFENRFLRTVRSIVEKSNQSIDPVDILRAARG